MIVKLFKHSNTYINSCRTKEGCVKGLQNQKCMSICVDESMMTENVMHVVFYTAMAHLRLSVNILTKYS